MSSPKKKALGKGLSALIGVPQESANAPAPAPLAQEQTADGARLLSIDPRKVRPNPQQPRRAFDEEPLQELAQSIRQDGVQEPVIVRERNGEYQLVSGERRVRASILAELDTIPAILREVSDEDMLKLGLIENVQREDLNAIELAEAYQQLAKTFNWTQEVVAAQVGKKRVTVTNTMRLLNLPKHIQQHVIAGEITGGHGRALLALETPEAQSRACQKIIKEGLSVRQAERLASAPKRTRTKRTETTKDPHVAAIEDDLRRKLGTKVRVTSNAEHRGKIEIEFYDLDDLERILDFFRNSR